MCLAIPMRVVTVAGFNASCEARGVSRQVSLFLLPEDSIMAGDHVLVHVGYAIQVLSAPDAAASWALFDMMNAAQDRVTQDWAAQDRAAQDRLHA